MQLPFIIILVCCFTNLLAFAQAGNETDRLALLDFKSKVTDDPLGILTSWNESIHFCQWHGVTCSADRVTMLDLHSQNLAGSVSPHIGNLSFLTVLQLYNNSFTDEIPPEIGNLQRLQILRLHNNSITGQIPVNISACSSLVRINFAINMLVGNIPVQLGLLSNLQALYLDKNNFTGGSWFTYDLNKKLHYDLSVGADLPRADAYVINGQPGAFFKCSSAISLGEGFLKNGQYPTLTIMSAGHALHVFINGQLSRTVFGSLENPKLTYSSTVKLRAGINRISLLSVAVGLPNVSVHYDTWNTGVLGPVTLKGLNEGTKDLTKQQWSYKRSFPLTEEEYLLRLDDVASTLKCWEAVSHIRNSLAKLNERPRIGKVTKSEDVYNLKSCCSSSDSVTRL